MTLILTLALAAAAPAAAQVPGARVNASGGDLYSYQDALLVLNGYAVPTSPLTPRTRELKVVPIYVTLTEERENFGFSGGVQPPENNEKASGVGLALSYFRGLNERWGFTVLGAWQRLSGSAVGIQDVKNSNLPGVFGNSFFGENDNGEILGYDTIDKKGFGVQAAAAVVYDPFGGREGLRLPLMAGLSALYLSEEADAVFASRALQKDIRVEIEQKNFLPGFFIGGSAQITTGDVRWVPFFTAHLNLRPDRRDYKVTRVSDGVVLLDSTESESEVFKPSLGLSVNYVPWGLGFNYIPSFFAFGSESHSAIHVFSLTKVLRF